MYFSEQGNVDDDATFITIFCSLQTADRGPQTTDRPQTADCKLEDTKNLPNKGDTIKRITSCEVRKLSLIHI